MGNQHELNDSIPNDIIFLYFNEISSKLVAQTGIASDRYHLGKLTLQSFREDPDFVLQVDGISDESITFKQAADMSIRCAYAFRKMGLKKGDVIVIMSTNNINISIPYHAAMYDGIATAALDRNLGVSELVDAFKVLQPKLVFSQSDRVADIQTSLKSLNNDAEVITFDQGTARTLDDFLQSTNESIDNFSPTEFNPEEELSIIVPTSGTTGLPKFAAITHKAQLIGSLCLWATYRDFPYPTYRMMLVTSVFQWISAHYMLATSPLVRITRLMSYEPITRKSACQMINKYKPSLALMSPTLLVSLMKPDECGPIDFTCFEKLFVGGSAVHKEVLDNFQAISPDTLIMTAYGATESAPITMADDPSRGSGRPFGCTQARLVDMETQEVIREPYRNGEMWVKTPAIFKGYYNNPEATKATFSEDGWFKTGDILYQDEHRNYHFVERAKLLLKYKNEQVSPTEVERVILRLAGVAAAAVVGRAHAEFGDLVVAFMVRRPGFLVTAQDVKQIVADNLSASKHLSGGVIFVDQLPTTPTHKVQITKLKEMAKTMQAE